MSRYNQYQFVAHNSDFDFGIDILCRYKGPDKDGYNKFFVAQPVEFQEQDASYHHPTPMLHINMDAAINLMDTLWIAGIRPSQRIVEPQNIDHLNKEIGWHRDVIDHLIKRKP